MWTAPSPEYMSQKLPLTTIPVLVWLTTMGLSHSFNGRSPTTAPLQLSLPDLRVIYRCCGIHGFAPAGKVSRASILQLFRDASHLWWLLCQLVYLLDHFSRFRQIQDRRPTWGSDEGWRALSCQSRLSLKRNISAHFNAKFQWKILALKELSHLNTNENTTHNIISFKISRTGNML